MTIRLIKYDAARKALSEARSIDEVKQIRDKAEAMRAYAKQAKDFDMANWAAEIRIRAERKLGEMLPSVISQGSGMKKKISHDAISLSDLGIKPDMSSRAQAMARIPEDEFEKAITEHREAQQELTSTTIRRMYAAGENKKELDKIKTGEIKAPTGKYDVIVIDPPWQMEKIGRDARPNQSCFDYPTMSEKELELFEIPSSDNCHIFIWSTHKHLPIAFRLIDKWVFKYVCTFVWHKPGGFQPFGLPQYNCEFSLYARKGNPKFVNLKDFNLCFNAPRGKHSEKPEKFYELIKRVTGGRRLDMFSRRKIDGFDSWGNQV